MKWLIVLTVKVVIGFLLLNVCGLVAIAWWMLVENWFDGGSGFLVLAFLTFIFGVLALFAELLPD
tara:strand:+ start:776 stop:970 length:195 start_codon:yes stop_codon:yes gene_type:complete